MMTDYDHNTATHIRLLLTVLLLCFTFGAAAQQFSVKAFRQLPNDITAYIHPVTDLNEETCALIKVVADADFAFSTPLGIVERRNEVGEVWLYVPHATRLLTLKHPRWGVIRDYRLPLRLEGRMTYELTLNLPAENTKVLLPWLSMQQPSLYRMPNYPQPLSSPSEPSTRRPRKPLHYLLMGQVGIGGDHPSWGLRVAAMRRWGLYLMAETDLQSIGPTNGSCNSQGQLLDGGGTPYYTGKVASHRWAATTGLLWQMDNHWMIYGGAGYGQYLLAWQRVEGELVKQADESIKGLAAEVGLIYCHRRLLFSAGAQSIQMKQWQATLGIGLRF